MSPDLAAFLHEASAVHRLITLIRQQCDDNEGTFSYLDSSEEFFRYVQTVGSASTSYAQALVDRAINRPNLTKFYRNRLVALKGFWSLLHEYVKPATDAHTLAIPVPLIDYLESQLRTFPNATDARFVILLSSRLNYFFQAATSYLRVLADQLAKRVPNAERFPDRLGFIGVPYSQGGELFTNILVAHELGHYAQHELREHSTLKRIVLDEWEANLKPRLDRVSAAWCYKRILAWAEEIYCDCFAISLIGPAFSFASLDLFNVLGVLERDTSREFSLFHPAVAVRFREQVSYLKFLGWWDEMQDPNLSAKSTLDTLAAIDRSEYTFPKTEPWGNELIDSFERVRPEIRNHLERQLPRPTETIEAFRASQGAIRRCLAEGIVPSALSRVHGLIDPSATINAAYRFYLESFNELIDRTDNFQSNHLSDRTELVSRLQQWVLKAVGDYRLIAQAQEK